MANQQDNYIGYRTTEHIEHDVCKVNPRQELN